jgi:tetratricopeptide (TPR) repeat protein
MSLFVDISSFGLRNVPKEMRKFILSLFIFFAALAPFLIFKNQPCPLSQVSSAVKDNIRVSFIPRAQLKSSEEIFLNYLKSRKDNLALVEIEKILSVEPDNITALWGKAEILRRNYKLKDSQVILNKLLSGDPRHTPSLITLSYIRYHDNRLDEALKILRQVLNQPNLESEDRALVYMLMGSINAKRASLGGFLSKIAYGTHVWGYFERAKVLAPDLSEVRLGLGTFCLLAPKIIGGNLEKAIEELEVAVKLTPDFATANARLAQAYKKKGNLEKYNFYLQRAKELDPENEVLKEIAKE